MKRTFSDTKTSLTAGLPTGILKCQITQIWHFSKAFGSEKLALAVWHIFGIIFTTASLDNLITQNDTKVPESVGTVLESYLLAFVPDRKCQNGTTNKLQYRKCSAAKHKLHNVKKISLGKVLVDSS